MAKILLVEDDPLMARMYQRKLVNDGYETSVAVDGEEGLVKIRSFRPDLVLLDIMMPKLNGLQVLERLKSDPTTAKTPVIILTNLGGTQDDIERGLELGAVAYLVKSAYRPDEVIAKVKEILEGYTRSKEIPKAAGESLGGATRVLEDTTKAALSSAEAASVPDKHLDSKHKQPREETRQKEQKQKEDKRNMAPKIPNISEPVPHIPSPSLREKEKETEGKKPSQEDNSEKKENQELQKKSLVHPSAGASREGQESLQQQPAKPYQDQDTEVLKKKKETGDDSASSNEMIW